ncbi:hypothetical protein SprV_0301120400 [Sparganum proliferum]
MGRPRPGPICVEKNSEDRRNNLRSQPHHRRQSQTRDTQISTAVAASQRQPPTASKVPTMSTNIPGTKQTCWTPPDQLQHPECTNRRLYVRISLASHTVN